MNDTVELITDEESYRKALAFLAAMASELPPMSPELYTALKRLEDITRQQVADYKHSRNV